MVVDLQESANIALITRWLGENKIRILNIAGPRESGIPSITKEATRLLRALIERVQSSN